jgi:hypothetical protein
MLLSLDISTSCTGWAVFDKSVLIDAGAVETSSDDFSSFFEKMTHVIDQIKKICQTNNYVIDYIAVESALKKFTPGRSSSDVIAKLVGFNFCLTYHLTTHFKAKNLYFDVKSARAYCGIKVPKKKDAKIYVYNYVSAKYPNLDWQYKKVTKKTNADLAPVKSWCVDMADAVVIGLAALPKVDQGTSDVL